MTPDNTSPRQNLAVIAKPYTAEGSYVDWAAILAGGVFALAISLLLISFGTSLGLSLTSPHRGEGVSSAWVAIAAGIWFAWVMVTGFGAGGYLCGRMRRQVGDAPADEVEVRDGVHGLMVWAVGALVSAMLAATSTGGILNASAATVGTATTAAEKTASSDYFANLLLRGGVQDSPSGKSGDGTAPASTALTLASNVAAGEVSQSVQQEIAVILARSATTGDMAERDRNYLVQLVAANSALDEEAARTRIDAVNAELDEARTEALEAVEKARVAGVVFGFIAAATLLIGAVAAFFAASAGGRHRDEGLGFDIFAPRR